MAYHCECYVKCIEKHFSVNKVCVRRSVLFKFEQIKNQTGNVEKGENQLKLNIQKESPRYMHLVKIKPFYNDKFDLFVRIEVF